VDISQFLPLLLKGLSELDFVEKVDIQTEVFVLKGRAILKENRFLQIYFNELTEVSLTESVVVVFCQRSVRN